MGKISIALTAIMFLALAAFMAPNILALNRGKVLRNIAIWLAIFAGLGLLYQATHSNGPISFPAFHNSGQQENTEPAADNKAAGGHDFNPPSE